MQQRFNYAEHAKKLLPKLMELSQAIAQGSIPRSLLDIVNIRASQLNGCAFCLDMHVKEAKIHGERELRVYHISIWRESPLFSDKERAALELTELLTRLSDHGIADEAYERVSKVLNHQEITDLMFAIGTINMWNRLNAVARTTPGTMDRMFGLDKADLK